MRRVFIESMLSCGFNVIGQARIDTRLYYVAVKKPGNSAGDRVHTAQNTRSYGLLI